MFLRTRVFFLVFLAAMSRAVDPKGWKEFVGQPAEAVCKQIREEHPELKVRSPPAS